jgi:hypothetical protein
MAQTTPTGAPHGGFTIRTYGDPVLKSMAAEVTNVDGKIATLCEQMFEMMYEAPGLHRRSAFRSRFSFTT